MPEPNTPQVPRSQAESYGWMADAPGGDINLDELFPNTEVAPQMQPPPTAQPTQSAPPPPQDFIVTATGTRYRSPEDAIKGIEEKDRIIAELRAKQAAETGHDPLRRTPQEPPKDPRQEMFERLSKAAQTGNHADYIETLQEITRQTIAPYAPMIAEVGREKAIRNVSAENPAIRDFVNSADYRAVLERRPRLAQAIQNAEQDPSLAEQLQEFYGLAYADAVSRQVPQIARQAAQSAAPPPPNPRPTLTPSHSTPPATSQYSGYSLDNLPVNRQARQEALKALKERFAGAQDTDWGKVGL